MEEIKEKLSHLVDEKYGKFTLGLCKDTNKKILGIRIPELRKIAKEMAKSQEAEKYIKDELKSKQEYLEEVLILGFVIGYIKVDIDRKLEYIKKFVPKIDSWEVSDTFIPTLKIKEKDLEKVWKFILPYVKDKREFYIRFAVIMMLDYYITEEYVDEVIKALDSVETEKYYARMAIAWCIAEIGIKYNEKAMKYLKSNNNLDDFTYNKSLQKMIESYRITDKQKEELRKMKRKIVNKNKI